MSLFGKSVSVRKSGGGRPMPILTRAQPPRVPARADVQRQGPEGAGVLGVPHFIFTLQLALFWQWAAASRPADEFSKLVFGRPGRSRTARETAVGATATRLRERRQAHYDGSKLSG